MNYKYLFNVQTDEKGRSTGFMDGYKPGDKLCVAYEGKIHVEPNEKPRQVLERLFEMFNTKHPSDYRGPSMSVGSVVVLGIAIQPNTYAVASVGFTPVDISQSEIVPGDPRWRA